MRQQPDRPKPGAAPPETILKPALLDRSLKTAGREQIVPGYTLLSILVRVFHFSHTVCASSLKSSSQ